MTVQSRMTVRSRLIGLALAFVACCPASAAIAATQSSLYRTDDQAAHYLTHRLEGWAGMDLRRFRAKTAYCVGVGQGRVSDGVEAYRSFSCVLNVRIASGKNGMRVFQLDLAKERHGWRTTSDSA